MAKCPTCGYDVEVPQKVWEIQPKTRPKAPRLKVSQFVCPKCGKRFRAYLKVA
jgi:predicted RNA-binding Zn-ribbon protein involved in translation (DUF1610 family)